MHIYGNSLAPNWGDVSSSSLQNTHGSLKRRWLASSSFRPHLCLTRALVWSLSRSATHDSTRHPSPRVTLGPLNSLVRLR